jgi:ABC-type sugar transport system ATPase subunit
MNLVPCEIVSGDFSPSHTPFGDSGGKPWAIPSHLLNLRDVSLQPPLRLELGFRPESVLLDPAHSGRELSAGHLRTTAVVRRLEYQGSSVLATLDLGKRVILVRIQASSAPSAQEGQPVDCIVDLNKASWFDAVTGRRCA